jgi:hypothetical protein
MRTRTGKLNNKQMNGAVYGQRRKVMNHSNEPHIRGSCPVC